MSKMKVIIIALVLVAGAFAHSHDELGFLWSSWKQVYGKEYHDVAAEAHRFSVFLQNYKFIHEWNNAGNTATLALNGFADLSPEEFSALYAGTISVDEEDETVVPVNSFESKIDITPSYWDWRNEVGVVTPVKDQGLCAAGWAFAVVASIESHFKLKGHFLASFSEQQILDCDKENYGCQGGFPHKALDYVKSKGLQVEHDYPYNGRQLTCRYKSSLAIKNLNTGYVYVTPRNADALKAAIHQQPTILLVQADQSVFQFYSSGVITTGCGASLNHAVTAVGYGHYSGHDAYFIKNSFGYIWGVQGYVYISTDTQYNAGLGACGVLSQPQYPKGLTE